MSSHGAISLIGIAWSGSVKSLTDHHADVVACDGERYRVPMPEPQHGPNGALRYVISKSSIGWKLGQIYRQYYPLDSAYPLSDIELVP